MATESTTSKPNIANGWYLYREGVGAWWRAVEVRDGRASANWMAPRGIPTAVLDGEWDGPRDRYDADVSEAMADHMGRLFREPGVEPEK